PKKKQRLDASASTPLEDRWASAVQSMEKASTLERDGLPALISSYASASGGFYDSLDDSDPDTKLKSQGSKANLEADMSVSTPREWTPCPPDPTLQIPGELVLAQAPKTGGSYWPAQLLEHVPGRKERYKVKFLDDEKYVIGRDKFWTSEEEGFIRCALGEWESAVQTTDNPESDDEDDGSGNVEDPSADTDALLPPPPAEDFQDLSVRAQLAYVKPVLRAILNKDYAPATEKHEAFMKGGSARAALLKAAGIRGGMDARFVKSVQKAICKWVLGGKPERTEAQFVGIAREGKEVNGAMDEATIKASSSESAPVESLGEKSTEACAMEGIDGPETMRADGQDGLLAEVSQAVATEPSLLPSHHPEVSKIAIPDVVPKVGWFFELYMFLSASQDMSAQPSPLTPPPDDEQQLPPGRDHQVGCEEFECLSGIEKLDYCLNVLLPESIQQLLLWRSGERTSPTLLSTQEEQRLHDLSARKAAETDWVDDVMRLRAAQARLWGVDLSKGTQEDKVDVVPGGTRTRPRTKTISRGNR
ncbi:hypothetical protein BU15DRAFT_44308, partial [Melanogaster broomeanus]